MEEEKRGAPRRRTLKAGKIVLSDWTTIDCRIRDLSDTGAKLELGGITKLPTTFRLQIISDNKLIPCTLVSQRGLPVGVEFAGPVTT